MKKVVIILFALFLSFQLVAAAEITLLNNDENLSQSETIIAKISGNFLDIITDANIFFYKGQIIDQNFRVAMEHKVEKIGDDFYLYALTSGKTPENYIISVENARYMKGAEVSTEKITKNFSITNDLADFSLKPGFVVASGDFSVEVQNLKENELTLTSDTMINNSGIRKIYVSDGVSTIESFTLKSGEVKKINFKLGSGDFSLQNIELKSDNTLYDFPVYLTTESGIIVHEEAFRIEPASLEISAKTDSSTKKVIYIYNTGNTDLNGISLTLSDSLSPYVTLSKSKLDLKSKTNTPVELTISSSKEVDVEGTLKAKTGNLTATLDLSLSFSKTSSGTTTNNQSKTCTELNGTLFNDKTQKCSNYVYARDNKCCIGTLTQIEQTSNNQIIAAVIIGVIIIGIVWFYFAKFRKAKKPVDFSKFAKPKLFGKK